jgi:hypothetical protein
MTEASVTSEFLDFVKWHLPCKAIKHADQSTIGLPDASITVLRRTTWIEVKLIKLGPRTPEYITVKDIILSSKHGKLQLETMRQLQDHGFAWYLVFIHKGNKWWTLIISPGSLHNMMKQQSGGFSLTPEVEGKRFSDMIKVITQESAT